MPFEQTNTNIDWNESLTKAKNPEEALSRLEARENIFLAEMQEFWEWEVKAAEFALRNQEELSAEISDCFPDLENLVLNAA